VRFSLDTEFGKHIGRKEDEKKAVDAIRTEINAGTFVRQRTGGESYQ